MNYARAWAVYSLTTSLLQVCTSGWAGDFPFEHREDIIYGRKFGTALTMDVFTPKKEAKGIGVILIASAGFVSSRDLILPVFIQPLTERGYTVFAVMHGSQPRYTIPEMIQDMNRAVRFIRYHAKDYGIDPANWRHGSFGRRPFSPDARNCWRSGGPKASDPVDRVSSRVQAVACFFPPTDFLNYGRDGDAKIHATDHAPPYRAAFDYRELDKTSRLWVSISDPQRLYDIARQISPISHVTADDPPTLIIHGDQDRLVPLQQSEVIIET